MSLSTSWKTGEQYIQLTNSCVWVAILTKTSVNILGGYAILHPSQTPKKLRDLPVLNLQKKKLSSCFLSFLLVSHYLQKVRNGSGKRYSFLHLMKWSAHTCLTLPPTLLQPYCSWSGWVPPASCINSMTCNNTGNTGIQRVILDYFCYSSVSQLDRILLNLPKVASHGCECYHQKNNILCIHI